MEVRQELFAVSGQEALVLKKKKSIKSCSMNELEWAMLHGLPWSWNSRRRGSREPHITAEGFTILLLGEALNNWNSTLAGQTRQQPLAWTILTIGGLVSNEKLTGYHELEEFSKGQRERASTSPYVPPTSQNPRWDPSWLSDVCATGKDPE